MAGECFGEDGDEAIVFVALEAVEEDEGGVWVAGWVFGVAEDVEASGILNSPIGGVLHT